MSNQINGLLQGLLLWKKCGFDMPFISSSKLMNVHGSMCILMYEYVCVFASLRIMGDYDIVMTHTKFICLHQRK